MGLLDRVNAAHAALRRPREETRYSADQWLEQYLIPSQNQFAFNGGVYPISQYGLTTTYQGDRAKEISQTLPGYMAALRSCPPAFAAQLVRATVLSQARFCFRNADWSPKAGRTFTTSALQPLQKPWTNATTGQLINVMEWHAGLAGNAYVTSRAKNRLRVLRPDWVVVVYGSDQQPDDAAHALDGEVIGYAYCNGGFAAGMYPVETLLPSEVAHWSPLPDPEGAGIGMSWITPAVREIQGDRAATDHKLKFFQNGATPNLVVKGIPAATKEQFNDIVDNLEEKHRGVANAYRTLYLTAGADATVVGSDLAQIDFKATQGAGETRISMLSRVHPVVLAASEGMQGSSLNAGNFSAARRIWADTWIYPVLSDLAAALSPLVRVPADAELWPKTGDMPILREDARDAADIEQVKATTVTQYINAGFTPVSSVAAVDAQDVTLLVHSGLISVQLQPPGAAPPGTGVSGPGAPALPGGARPKALPVGERKFDPAEPRNPLTGEWGHGGAGNALKGMAHALAEPKDGEPWPAGHGQPIVSTKIGGVTIAAISGHDGLTISDGNRSVVMDEKHLGQFRDDLDNAQYGQRVGGKYGYDWDPTKPESIYGDVTDEVDGKGFSHTQYEIRPTRSAPVESDAGEDIRPDFELVLAGAHDDWHWDLDKASGTILTLKQAEAIQAAMDRNGYAKRVEFGTAPVDVFAPRRGATAYRMQDEDGHAATVTWNKGEYGRVNDALWELVTGEVDNPDGTTSDSTVTSKTVKTGAGLVLLQRHGTGPDAVVFITPKYDAKWALAIPVDQARDFSAGMLEEMTFRSLMPTERAAGHDTTPGHDELHHYWVAGPGLGEWANSPKPWTTLVALLVEHVKPPRPLATYKKWAASWFHEVKGYWPGDQKGKNPVGPG